MCGGRGARDSPDSGIERRVGHVLADSVVVAAPSLAGGGAEAGTVAHGAMAQDL